MARWTVIVACLVAVACGGAFAAVGAEGIVFLDQDRDGVFGAGDTGVAGVVVSDGVSVTRTGVDGRFAVTLAAGARFVFVSTPDGTRASAGWYRAVQADAAYDFPLVPAAGSGPLVFAQLSDLHYAPDPDAFSDAFDDREMAVLPGPVIETLVGEVNALAPDFVILTGDIIANAKGPSLDAVRSWFDAVDSLLVDRLDVPVYATVGNHDQVRLPAVDKTVYEGHFGPTYYSFNVKGTHCVVLDPHQLADTKQIYSISAAQLAWLREDLAWVDARTPILVFCHEPSADWAPTAESEALFELLAEVQITALLTGHWHTNFVLREAPFYEFTSGAVCGSWWEGPNPDGTEFGYRVYEVARGRLSSTWRAIGKSGVSFAAPAAAALVWADRLVASVWGQAASASVRWDDEAARGVGVSSNGLWTTAAANLNVTTLDEGIHTLTVSFAMEDGTEVAGAQSFYVLQPGLAIGDYIDHPEVFQGKMVGLPELQVRAVMGVDLSATDGVDTFIVAKFPLVVAKGDHISLVGMYRPTSADPIKSFDPIFSVKLEAK